MRLSRYLRPVALVAAAGWWGCSPGDGMIAYVGMTLWDGQGDRATPNGVVVVDSDSIWAVGSADEVNVPRGARVEQLDGKWVIPGLIDANTQPERWMLSGFLQYGVTSVRDAGTPPDSVLALRQDVALGVVTGPRIFAAGAPIDGMPPGLPVAEGVRTPVEARKAVDNRKLLEVSHVMVAPKINRPVLQALVNEAKLLRMPIGAHVGRVDAVTAAREGVTSLEHLSGVVEATVSNPAAYFQAHADYYRGWVRSQRAWNTLDSASLERTARALASTAVVLVPTLIHQAAFANLQNPDFINELDLSAVPESIVTRWDIPRLVQRGGITSSDFAAFRLGLARQRLFVRRFLAAGGRVAAGTGAPDPLLAPGASLHGELRQLVEAGLTPLEALRAATNHAAQILMADTVGVIRVGGAADFVILNADPLADIANVGSIDRVVARGVAYTRLDLISR